MKRSEMIKDLAVYIEHFVPIADPKIADGILAFLEKKGMTAPAFKDYTMDSLRNHINAEVHKDESGKYVYTKGWESEK